MENYEIKDNEFIYSLDGEQLANIGFSLLDDKTYIIEHTWVAKKGRNQGLAAKLTTAFFEKVRKENRTIIPLCQYTKSFLKKNPNYLDLVSK